MFGWKKRERPPTADLVCPQCLKEKKRSIVYCGFGLNVPCYWDENGKFHDEYINNLLHLMHQCSNGHVFGRTRPYLIER